MPVYPPAPLCNPKGLSDLGAYAIRAMMAKGMIVETDHLSVKARQEALAILEAEQYPGVISSHSWGDLGSQRRLQRLGGLVGPISSVATEFAEKWRVARAGADPRFLFGTPFGSDINGLHSQPVPRAGAAQNPVSYPFRSFDGGSVYDINGDGVDHYGLYPDWIEDLRKVAGQQIVDDMANGAEAYLQLWQRTRSHARRRLSRASRAARSVESQAPGERRLDVDAARSGVVGEARHSEAGDAEVTVETLRILPRQAEQRTRGRASQGHSERSLGRSLPALLARAVVELDERPRSDEQQLTGASSLALATLLDGQAPAQLALGQGLLGVRIFVEQRAGGEDPRSHRDHGYRPTPRIGALFAACGGHKSPQDERGAPTTAA